MKFVKVSSKFENERFTLSTIGKLICYYFLKVAQHLARSLMLLGLSLLGLICSCLKLEGPKHLARSSLMDLHLDTRLQSGHTTTVDALWSGIPVVVWPARSMVSRAASGEHKCQKRPEIDLIRSKRDLEQCHTWAGIALAAGLQWSVARTRGDYVELARRLLRKKQRTGASGARQFVAQARQRTPLFNFLSWVSRWETALTLGACLLVFYFFCFLLFFVLVSRCETALTLGTCLF